MRTTSLLAAAALILAAGPAFAQNQSGSTQTPPSYNANSQTVETVNSLPRNAETTTGERAGSALSTTQTAPAQPTAPVR